jgi:hypothetical protein
VVQVIATPSAETAVAPSGEQRAPSCGALLEVGGLVGEVDVGAGAVVVVVRPCGAGAVVVGAAVVVVVAPVVEVVDAAGAASDDGVAGAALDDGAVVSGSVEVVDCSVAATFRSPSRSSSVAAAPTAPRARIVTETGAATRAHFDQPR